MENILRHFVEQVIRHFPNNTMDFGKRSESEFRIKVLFDFINSAGQESEHIKNIDRYTMCRSESVYLDKLIFIIEHFKIELNTDRQTKLNQIKKNYKYKNSKDAISYLEAFHRAFP